MNVTSPLSEIPTMNELLRVVRFESLHAERIWRFRRGGAAIADIKNASAARYECAAL
jgi:hypothetical protein